MKKVLAPLAVLVLAGSASAGVLHTGLTLQAVGEGAATGGAAADSLATVYDNWNSPPSTLRALYPVGGDEVADDLMMNPVGFGLLTNLGFAVGNTAATGSGRAMTGGVVEIKFYDFVTLAPIASSGGFTSFTANLPAGFATTPLQPGGSSRVQFGSGALASLGWQFSTPMILASLKYVSVTGTGGFTLADAGTQIRSGGTVGSSSDAMLKMNGMFGFPEPIGFGGTPKADMGWMVEVNTVPTPGALAVLGMAGLVAGRRRR